MYTVYVYIVVILPFDDYDEASTVIASHHTACPADKIASEADRGFAVVCRR